MTEDQLVRWLYVLLAGMAGGTAGLLMPLSERWPAGLVATKAAGRLMRSALPQMGRSS
jgi:hypothetical protein